MEYDQDDRATGSLPEFGAIFMSNLLTKKECFKRKIFALPSSQAEFVKHVKAGMILFLFEFNKRQLFGVYQASSDGAMDIVPHAFNYSGRRFPAHVCFTPIWYCDPLSEREFQDAIIDNYFSARKFNFGLSEDQVHRLLSLFSSRKMKKEIVPQPLSKAAIGVAGKDRRSVGDDRFELSERGYTEPTENDEFNHAVFSDYHANPSVQEDEVLIDDRVNTEEKVSPLVQGDFLAKRRRIDNDDRLLANDVAEIYNYGALHIFHTDSPRDSLDELRKLAAVRQLLAVERVQNENQVDKIRNAVLSSESVMGPLDVRTADDDRFMQRNRLFDEYNTDNGFGSDHYEKPLDTSKHAIDDDRFLFDDCVQRNQNIRDIVKPMVYGDGNLIEDHHCSMNRKLENRYHLDRNVSPFSAFEHNANLLHKTSETTSGGRFPVNDRIQSEPNFGACSVEDLSSAEFSRPLHCDHRIINDRKYPIVERRVSENMVDSTFCSATSTRNAGYFENVGGRVVDNGRFRKSEGVDNQKDIHTHIGRDIFLGCPSSFNQKRNLSAFSDKSLPEKGLSQLNVAHNFGPSRATITRSTPYSPEHPNLSYGLNASIAANQNSFVRENPHRGSVEDFYSCENRSSPYILESKKSSRSLDIAPEFGNKGLPTNTSSGHQSSLRHEAASSFLNSDLSMHVDLNTSVPVNYRGSLFSKSFLARPSTDHENIIEDEGAMFDYPSKSSGNHFAFDENLATASQHTSKHVPRQEMDMLAGKDFISFEAKDSSLGIYHSERDLTGYENPYIGIPSNMSRQVNHETSEAPHSDSNVNRKSVFARLTSREEFQGGEEGNESGFDRRDCYMEATADEVMEMLRQSNNLSVRKSSLKKSRVVGLPKHGESAFDEKQVHSHIENKSSAIKKKLKDAHLAMEESIDEVPKDIRTMDFRRRSETKKNLVGASTDSDTCNKITGANQEVGNSMKMTLKRKKLVRPVFGKDESATDTICSNQNSRLPVQVIEKEDKRNGEKAISICEAEMANDNTRLNDVLVSHTHQSMDCNIKEHSSPEEQKDIGVHVLPSSSSELKEHKTSIVGLPIDSSQALLTETTPHESVGNQTSVEVILSKNVDSTASSLNLEESSSVGSELGAGGLNNPIEEKRPRMVKRKRKIIKIESATATVCSNQKNSRVPDQITENDDKRDYEKAISICESEMPNDNTRLNDVLVLHTHQSMDCNIKEHSNPEEQKDIEVHVLPSSSTGLKEHKTSIVGLHIDRSKALLIETTPPESVGNQTSVGDILSKNVDSTASSLNLGESPIEEKRPKMVKRKKKIIKKIIKKVIKTNKTGMEPSQ